MQKPAAQVFALCVLFATQTNGFPHCISDSGDSVDVWAAFKSPKGTNYDFWDINMPLAGSWHSMNSTTVGALGSTLQQLWTEPSIEYILWNDSPPGSTADYNFTVGHSKGVWAWNTGTGEAIILQHSVPLFPLGPGQVSQYMGLGSNAWMYGQHAVCFQTSLRALTRLATYAQLIVPGIYDSRTSPVTPAPLSGLVGGEYSTEPICDPVSFLTLGDRNVTYFSKSTQWNNELYAECLAPRLQTSLAVESWIRGSAEGPFCGTEKVYDVVSVSYPSGHTFTEYDDHSKWCVGLNTDWFCASDINRMTTQYERGGSAYCWHEPSLASAVMDSITKMDTC
jgi:deoxyribonuclease-2